MRGLLRKHAKMIRVLMYLPKRPRDMIFCLCKGLRWQSGWRLYGLPLIQRKGRGSKIRIGRGFVACSDPRKNSLGVFQRVTIKTIAHGAEVFIGDDVAVSGCSIVAEGSIKIGNRVLIGSGALITDHDGHAIDPVERANGRRGVVRSVVLEDDVFVGGRAIVLKGVTIGEGSIVGAGAVVTKSVPPFTIVAGNPARPVGLVRTEAKAQAIEPETATNGE